MGRRWQHAFQTPENAKRLEIVIICALTLEADVVKDLDVFPDCKWYANGPRGYGKAKGAPNFYSTGYIASYNVVLAHIPKTEKANAPAVASHSRMSFPNIRLALILGVCGAVPSKLATAISKTRWFWVMLSSAMELFNTTLALSYLTGSSHRIPCWRG
ncbi:hypothetical protein PpBr36_03286 [Pyricularia pennisetigena]|uniref:hypothetical protein n=1 Tax=Pyricularia pennisetigena TaxID=1578925 RepID=UPI00114F87B0|nr:hypothetical protein PpBr36_03286 [Pyricularia pennisetigena]TLS30983.1 hypothetical protein PpBr36_03286 [Pyricularia pennisetigena]